jgi:hypothetical protein
MTYITHARTAEELRLEILSDLNRRIDALAKQREAFGRGAAGKARFDGRINELEDMLRFYSDLQIVPPSKSRSREV